MTDLDALSASARPRPAALVRRLRPRIAPIYGFVLFGVLWFSVVTGAAAIVLFAAAYALGVERADAATAGWLGGVVVAATGFVLWARRRLQCATTLAQEGELLLARVISVSRGVGRAGPLTTASLACDHAARTWSTTLHVQGHAPELYEGTTAPVLLAPGLPYCGVFPSEGKLVAVAVTSSS